METDEQLEINWHSDLKQYVPVVWGHEKDAGMNGENGSRLAERL